MNSINKIFPSVPSPELISRDRRPAAVSSDESTPAPLKDYTDLSSEWHLESNTEDLIKQMLSAFQKKYPGIKIAIADGLPQEDLSSAFASLGDGTHLIISKDFLEKMGSSQQFYEKGKSTLIKLLNQLSKGAGTYRARGAYIGKDEITLWSAQKPSNALDITGKGKTEAPVPAGLSAMKDTSISERLYSTKKSSLKMISYSFTRLAGARTKGQIQTVMANTRRNIANLRLSTCFGDKDEQMKARAAIASMQKVLQRGSRKIRRLSDEELTTLRMKRAQRRQEQEKAMALALERRKMRANRLTADESIRKEGQLEELNQSFRFRKYSKYAIDKEREALAVPPQISMPADTAFAGPAVSEPLTGADITISSVSLDF